MKDAFYAVLVLSSVAIGVVSARQSRVENAILRGEIAVLALENERLERESCSLTTTDIANYLRQVPSERSLELMAMSQEEWNAERDRCMVEDC